MQRLISNTNTPRLNIKKKRGKKHGISYRNKWNRWAFQSRRRNLLNKKYCIKSLRITDSREPKYQSKISYPEKSSAEEPSEKSEFAGIGRLMK